MTTINIRIENDLKNKAGKTLSLIGLDMSSAVKIFLHQVVTEKGLPFTPTKNMREIKTRWDKESREAIRSGKRYTSARALFAANE